MLKYSITTEPAGPDPRAGHRGGSAGPDESGKAAPKGSETGWAGGDAAVWPPAAAAAAQERGAEARDTAPPASSTP
jgi:hypothetical protein